MSFDSSSFLEGLFTVDPSPEGENPEVQTLTTDPTLAEESTPADEKAAVDDDDRRWSEDAAESTPATDGSPKDLLPEIINAPGSPFDGWVRRPNAEDRMGWFFGRWKTFCASNASLDDGMDDY